MIIETLAKFIAWLPFPLNYIAIIAAFFGLGYGIMFFIWLALLFFGGLAK
jgi:hypothetical protein